jgi:DNA-binding response OmpR family regulator
MSTALLLADHEPKSRKDLERNLRHDGFEIVADARGRPDLVIADDDSDFERWRGEAPVIVLGRSEADAVERVRAFRRGCDDYVARPFHYDELLERIRAVLRRAQPPEPELIEAGPITIDLRTRAVRVLGTRVALAQKEYELLLMLARDPERVFTKQDLLRDVWD